MKVSKNIFKAYDIRGIYGKELTISSAKLIAKSLCQIYKNGNDKIVIGRDGRLSSHDLSVALTNQFLECGKRYKYWPSSNAYSIFCCRKSKIKFWNYDYR